MGALIAPARAGFAPPERSPLLKYTRSQHLLSPHTLPLEKQVLPVPRYWLIPQGCPTMPQAQGAVRV